MCTGLNTLILVYVLHTDSVHASRGHFTVRWCSLNLSSYSCGCVCVDGSLSPAPRAAGPAKDDWSAV